MKCISKLLVLFFVGGFLPAKAFAQASELDHKVVRRLTVFPFKVPSAFKEVAEDSWWEVRKFLTDKKKFLVASRRFLVQKEVLQPRGALQPADVLILGRLLDAHALITFFLEDDQYQLEAYDGRTGQTLWRGKIELNTSLPKSVQLKSATMRLAQDFIQAFPYQGFVMEDKLRSSVVYQQEGEWYFDGFTGLDFPANPGDPVQVVRLTSTSLRPLFEDGGERKLMAEGVVAERLRDRVRVKLSATSANARLQHFDLLRFPKEFQKIEQQLTLRDIPADIYTVTDEQRENSEKRRLSTALSFLGSLALIFALAL